MKKEDIEKLITILGTVALVMILTFQMWHTVGLYLTYTKITHDIQKVFAAYFLAFTIELMVFIFVWNGYRDAGAWFSICLFFVGILFNEEYTGIEFNITMDPFQVNRYYFPPKFIASTLLQFMSSLSIWYLTELHTKSRQKQLLSTQIAELSTQETELNNNIAELTSKQVEQQQRIADTQKVMKQMKQEVIQLEDSIQELQQRETDLKNEITSLKKQKAGATPRNTLN